MTSSPLTTAGPPIEPLEGEPSLDGRRGAGDTVFLNLTRGAALVIVVALAGVFVFLAIEGVPGTHASSGSYGGKSDFLHYVGPLVFGTVLAAVLALLVAVPFSIGIALFVSHYAPRRLATPVAYLIDLLAAVPSIVYGIWGLTALAPRLVPVYVWLTDHLSFIPLFEGPAAATGKTMLTIGLILAIMILPIMTAIMREIFLQTPTLHQEAALALGATRWEMIRLTVFPYARSGMVSATMLGLGRALGETMAVAIVIQPSLSYLVNLTQETSSGTIASNIALRFAEATPTTLHVLIATGLVLFALTFAVNAAARGIVARADRKFAA